MYTYDLLSIRKYVFIFYVYQRSVLSSHHRLISHATENYLFDTGRFCAKDEKVTMARKVLFTE